MHSYARHILHRCIHGLHFSCRWCRGGAPGDLIAWGILNSAYTSADYALVLDEEIVRLSGYLIVQGTADSTDLAFAGSAYGRHVYMSYGATVSRAIRESYGPAAPSYNDQISLQRAVQSPYTRHVIRHHFWEWKPKTDDEKEKKNRAGEQEAKVSLDASSGK